MSKEIDIIRQNGAGTSVAPSQAVERSLSRHAYEPQDPSEAFQLAQWVVASGSYSHLKTPEQVFLILAQGKEQGLSAMQALNIVDIIQGKPTIKAQGLAALVMRSGEADYLKCVETTNHHATWKTHRRGDPDPDPTVLTFTIEDAQKLGLTGKDNWRKQPGTMLRWRAAAAICRLVYPDVVLGLYAREELEEDEPYRQSSPARVRNLPATEIPEETSAPKTATESLKAKLRSADAERRAAESRSEPPVVEAEIVEAADEMAEHQERKARLIQKLDHLDTQTGEEAEDPTPQTPPAESEDEKAEREHRKQQIRKAYKVHQDALAELLGPERARTAWYSEGGPQNVKKLSNLQTMEDKLEKAKVLSRKFELADLIMGHESTIKELSSEPWGGMELELDEPWSHTIETLEAHESKCVARVQELKQASAPAGQSEPPPPEDGDLFDPPPWDME